MKQPDWLSNDRVVGTEWFWLNMWTWKLDGGPTRRSTGSGFDEWGVEAYHWYGDPAVSPDAQSWR